MDVREFDELIKNNLDGFSQLPEKEIEKAIFGKVFFQNLWVFHKLKLISSILLIAGGTTFSLSYFEQDKSDYTAQDISVEVQDQQIVELTEQDNKKKTVNNEPTIQNESTNLKDEEVEPDVINEPKSINDQFLTDNFSEVKKKTKKTAVDAINKKDILKDDSPDKSILVPSDNEKELKEENFKKPNHSRSNRYDLTNTIINVDENVDDVNRDEEIKKLKVSTLTIAALHTCIPDIDVINVPAPNLSDYANDQKKRGLSFDAYFSPINQTDVDDILDPKFQNYWWDFYKENDMERSGFGGGFNISYNFNNFKINSGLNIDQIFDYKPKYEYFTHVDSIYGYSGANITLVNVAYVSGLMVYGEDTAVILHVDPNDRNLVDEIQEDANRLNYIRIPITLGYEFEFKRASFELNAGVEYTRMIQAKGISYKYGYVDVGIRPYPYYYYDDMVASTYQNNRESLRIDNWNYVANAIARVRLTNSLDLFSSVKFQYNTNNIMSDDYLLEKTYKKYGFNFGVTYYLNPRLSLKETVSPAFD